MFLGKGVLKICSKFTGEDPHRIAISIKLQRNFIEIILRHGYFPVNLLQIFREPFYRNTYGGLLLETYFFRWRPWTLEEWQMISNIFHVYIRDKLEKIFVYLLCYCLPFTAWKMPEQGVFPDPYFPYSDCIRTFITEIYVVNHRNQSENLYSDTFYSVFLRN